MKLASIRSGSSGNAVLVTAGKTSLLVDCGISGKAAEAGLRDLGVEPGDLRGILVTHEHQDHIGGIGIMSRRYHLPVYANGGTWAAMESVLGRIDDANRRVFAHTEEFSIGEIGIQPFSIPHDAADPVGYSFTAGGARASVATDIGTLEEPLFRALKGSRAVLLEANHDRNMLEMGRYPWPLKQRIRGERGHLSNDEAGKAASFLVRMGVEKLLLGHLSRENNYPLLARQTVVNILQDGGMEPGRDLELYVAPGDAVSPALEI